MSALDMFYIGYFGLVYFAWSLVNMMIAQDKKLSSSGGGAFLASLLFSPLVVWCYVSAMSKK